MKNKRHIKSFNEATENLNISDVSESKIYNDIEPLTIEEFSSIREALYAVKTSTSPSSFQAKQFFTDEENFEIVIEKLRMLLLYGSEKKL